MNPSEMNNTQPPRPVRTRGIVAACLLTVAASAVAQAPARTTGYPAVTIAGTEVRSLHSAQTGRDYEIDVYLPSNYGQNTAQRYPVLYLLDAQWDFKLLASIQGGLLYDRFNPEIIVVGITWPGINVDYNALRALDLTPTSVAATPGSGGAPRFLAFLTQELIPFIEANYRADPDPAKRGLMGNSLGGLFALYTLFTQPTLFGGYVAGSPAVTYANRHLFAVEAQYAAAHRDLHAKLFIAVGSGEPLALPVVEFAGIMRTRGYTGLTMERRVIEGERHASNKPEGLNRGLRFIFGSP